MKIRFFTIHLVVGMLFTLFVSGIGAANQPNIVLILADDQGWNGLSVPMDPDDPSSGSIYYRTPNLEKFARQGMRFSQAYSPSPTCSPSRHSIQFGRTPISMRQFGPTSRVAGTIQKKSMVNILKKVNSNYAAAHFGKWHLRLEPEKLGYDEDDGKSSNKQCTDPRDPKFIFSLTQKATDFMERQVRKKKPFYLQVSHYANHTKFTALPETIKKYETEYSKNATKYQNNPLWAAMNENLDTGVGILLDKIRDLGIDDNTYVIYTADNGYERQKRGDWDVKDVEDRAYYEAYPLRSHKYTVNEGGLRVPFIVRGPGIPANTHSRTKVIGIDIFPTVLDIVGGLEALPSEVEGGTILPTLLNDAGQVVKRKHSFLPFRYSKGNWHHDVAVVDGEYKVLKDITNNKMYLWNLKEDPGESVNLIGEKPERAMEMYNKLTEYLAQHEWDEAMASESESPKKNVKKKRTRPGSDQ